MKKFFRFVMFVLFIIISFIGYKKYIEYNNIESLLKNIEEEKFLINNYSIFGTYFNIEGCTHKKLSENASLVLKNKNEEIVINSIFYERDNKTCFYLSENNNEGIYLDELKEGVFLLFVKDNELYYTLSNQTNYEDLEYYTITKDSSNNKININFNEQDYVKFEIKDTNLPEDVYDITIDPGHGGNDVGTSGKLNGIIYYESDITLDISLKLKDYLEDIGLKVKITRDDDSYLSPYGLEGRAVIPNIVKSKYSLSIHVNSAIGKMYYGGVEVYIPNDINTEFAQTIASNLSLVVGYSKKDTDKVSNGIYFTSFTKDDVNDSKNEMLEQNLQAYDIKVGAPYMYMIREVGGVNTYAYVDGRNDKYGLNPYYNSNHTAEPYLIELGYVNYSSDLNKLVNNSDNFAKAISKSIEEYLKIS